MPELVIPKVIRCNPEPAKPVPRYVPEADPYTGRVKAKPLEQCESDEEFLTYLRASIDSGVWGNLTEHLIIPYMVEGLNDPEAISEYIKCNISPQEAWMQEATKTPWHGEKFRVVSPVRLESAHHKLQVRNVVIDAIKSGATSLLKIEMKIRPTHPEISEDEINEVLDLLMVKGILEKA